MHINAEQLKALQEAAGGDDGGGQLLLVDESESVKREEAEESLEEEMKKVAEDLRSQIRELVHAIILPYLPCRSMGHLHSLLYLS